MLTGAAGNLTLEPAHPAMDSAKSVAARSRTPAIEETDFEIKETLLSGAALVARNGLRWQEACLTGHASAKNLQAMNHVIATTPEDASQVTGWGVRGTFFTISHAASRTPLFASKPSARPAPDHALWAC